jgi:hypothetical protein
LTSPVISRSFGVNPNKIADTPNTVASFSLLNKLPGIKLNLQNSNANNGPPKDGEYRLLFRMIPTKVSDYQKKKRSDCHIWPTGTFLQIEQRAGGARIITQPMKLAQRHQQSHDLKEWKGICKHLDLTSHVMVLHPSIQLDFEICCHDTQAYMYSLDICKYRSPKLLMEQLLSPGEQQLKRLSIESSFSKALDMMKNNAVLLDSDDDGDDNDDIIETKHITFSLKDPVTKSAIVTPVRGTKCRHFSVSHFHLAGISGSHSDYVCLFSHFLVFPFFTCILRAFQSIDIFLSVLIWSHILSLMNLSTANAGSVEIVKIGFPTRTWNIVN